MSPPGQARPGDCYIDDCGQVREVVSVTSAHDVLVNALDARMRLRTPNFYRDSTTALCALHGATTGREKRDYQRRKYRLTQQSRRIACSTS